MVKTLSPSQPTAMLDDEPDVVPVAACPMCHTPAPLTRNAVDGSWQCVRCGQHWDLARLATVAAYAAWAVEHDRLLVR